MRQSANLLCSVALLLSCSAFARRPSHPKVENAKLFIQESILKKANVEVPQELSKLHDASTKALKEKHLTQYGINLDDDHASSNIEVHEVTELVYGDIDTVGAVPGWWNYVPCTQQSVINSEATFSETYDNVTDTYHIWLGPANGCYPGGLYHFSVTGWDQLETYSGYRLAYSDRNSYDKEICYNFIGFGWVNGATSCKSTADQENDMTDDVPPVDYVCRANSLGPASYNQGSSDYLNCPQEYHNDFEVDEFYDVLSDEPVLLSENHEQLVITVYATAGCHEGTEIYHMAYLTNTCVAYAILDEVGTIDAHYDDHHYYTVMINSDATYHFFWENDDSDEIGWCIEKISGMPDDDDDDDDDDDGIYEVLDGHDTFGPNSKLDYCEHHGMNYGYKTTIMYEGMGVGTDDDLTTLEKVGIAAVVLGGVLAFFHVLIYAYSAVFTQNMASYKPAASTEVEMNSA